MTDEALMARRASGFLILRRQIHSPYRGVDREPFVPVLIQEELEPTFIPNDPNAPIWTFYRNGWRRDALRLYEQNALTVQGLTSPLLTSAVAAREVAHLIPNEERAYEVLHCVVIDFEEANWKSEPSSGFLGFDVAYPGGDFYSAILNGMLIKPNTVLKHRFGGSLNEHRLFSSLEVCTEYLRAFRLEVRTEAAMPFVTWALGESSFWKGAASGVTAG